MLALAAVIIGADAYKDGLRKTRQTLIEVSLVRFGKFVDTPLDTGSVAAYEGEDSSDR